MKIFYLFILFLNFSCGKNKPIKFSTLGDNFSVQHQEAVVDEVLENSSQLGNLEFINLDKEIILLSNPLWTYKNKKFFLLNENEYYFSDSENFPWQYIESRFFETIGNDFFYFRQKNKIDLSVEDLFFQLITLTKKNESSVENAMMIEGEIAFFDGRLNSQDIYSRDRFLLNLYRRHGFENELILQRKLIEGENLFFTNSRIGEEYTLFMDELVPRKFPLREKDEKVLLEANSFFHQAVSKNDIINQIHRDYNLLFYFTKNKLKTIFFNKKLPIKNVLLQLDPGIQFNDQNQILKSSEVGRNEFILDFPRKFMWENNIFSKGIILDKKTMSLAQYSNSIDVFRYYEGSFQEILSKQYDEDKEELFFHGPDVEFNLNKGDIFNLTIKEEIYSTEFFEEEKEVEVILKDPQLVCERYELNTNKLCLDNRRVFKVKGKFRSFVGNKLLKTQEFQPDLKAENLRNLEPHNNENEKLVLAMLESNGEKFKMINRKNSLNHHFLGDIKVKINFPPQECKAIETGFIGFVEPNDKIKLKKDLNTFNNYYCFGSKYSHRLIKKTLNKMSN